MWTHERLKVKNWRDERVRYKQHKLNGHRFTAWRQQDGGLVGFERIIRPDREMTRLRPDVVRYDWWRALEEIPLASSVDGELYVPFGNAGDAAHAIAGCLDTLEFRPFAVPWWDNRDLRTCTDFSYVDGLLKRVGLKLVSWFYLRAHDDFELLCRDAADLGVEGWVLKNANYAEWYKVKPTKSIDAIVTGFKDGDGKYVGLVGSLKVSAYFDDKLTEIASVSGMDDETRLDIDEKKDLDRVCEIAYQDVGNGKRLIHPRFLRWREDKPADQCAYEWSDL